MHFLAKQEIAHTSNFTPLVNLGKSPGVSYLGNGSKYEVYFSVLSIGKDCIRTSEERNTVVLCVYSPD